MRNFQKYLGLLATTSLVLTGVFGFVQITYAAPAFNTFPVTYSGELDHDLPLIDAKNFTDSGSFSTSQADHDNGVQADPGDIVEVSIYYHNGAANTDENVAHNTLIRAFANPALGSSANTYTLGATISADNAAEVSSTAAFHGGDIQVHIQGGTSQSLTLVPGSVRVLRNQGQSPKPVAQSLPDTVFQNGVNIGDVRGCFEFHGFVNFKLQVGSQVVETRDLSITKRVLNVTRGESAFQDSVIANPGERVRFEIRFSTSGNASQNNVIVRDILPTQLLYASGTMRIDGATVSNETELFASGTNLGSLSANTTKVITFEANVAGSGSFSGTTTLTNTTNVRSDQVITRQDTADVVVQLVAGTQFSLRKTAFNITKGVDATSQAADPGDIITYALYVKNTGGSTLVNFTIEDNIHDILELAEITDLGGAVSVNSVIRYSPVDVTAGVEIGRTFQVRIRSANLFPADSDLVMTNVYGNEIRVPVRKPQVAGAVTPPRTGPTEWLAVLLATIATTGYWVYRRKLKVESEKWKV